MPTQIEKLKAYAGHLLDAFILLRERYAILSPMLFDNEVVARHGAKERGRGFNILRNSLFLSCAQLAMDDDERTPSIRNLMRSVTDEKLRADFRSRYANWVISPITGEDPEILAALQKMQVKVNTERGEHFDQLYYEMTELWSQLSTSSEIKAFQTIRDKVSAHTEIRFSADKYQFVDVSKLGLKWGDLKKTVDTMQRLVELLELLIRNAGFAWDTLDAQLDDASKNYWNG
jgi:AbiU2